MILFGRGNLKIGVRRGHFIGDPTLSDRKDGDLLIVDLLLISLIIFRPNNRLFVAMKKFMTDKYDVSWHEAVSKAEREAYKAGYKSGEERAEKERQHYYDLCQKHKKEMKRLEGENTHLREAFRILTSDRVD